MNWAQRNFDGIAQHNFETGVESRKREGTSCLLANEVGNDFPKGNHCFECSNRKDFWN